MSVAGSYDIVVKTPLGEQRGRFAVQAAGERFSGSLSGDLGSVEIAQGQVSGDTLNWSMEVREPMALKLDCTATVTGDTVTGTVKAGFFGSFPMSGTRVA